MIEIKKPINKCKTCDSCGNENTWRLKLYMNEQDGTQTNSVHLCSGCVDMAKCKVDDAERHKWK